MMFYQIRETTPFQMVEAVKSNNQEAWIQHSECGLLPDCYGALLTKRQEMEERH